MTCKELFLAYDAQGDMLAPGVLRALLVTALIDEGWNIERCRTLSRVYICEDNARVGTETIEFDGPISEMPADIYDELKGRLK